MGESKYLQEAEPKFFPVRNGLVFQEEVMRGFEFAWSSGVFECVYV